MRALLVALLLTAAACSPPATQEATEPPAEAPAPSVELGPYTNMWDSDQFSRFNHTLHTETPGRQVLALEARTEGGTETVAVYPADANGERDGGRIVFVIATTGGNRQAQEVDVPEAGLPVVVVVENAAGRRGAGSYTLTLQPAAP